MVLIFMHRQLDCSNRRTEIITFKNSLFVWHLKVRHTRNLWISLNKSIVNINCNNSFISQSIVIKIGTDVVGTTITIFVNFHVFTVNNNDFVASLTFRVWVRTFSLPIVNCNLFLICFGFSY